MNVTVTYETDARAVAEARGHQIIVDQPAANRGTDEGMTPPELLLASLGTCALYYAAQYLTAQGLSARGSQILVDAGKAANPARMEDFRIRLQIPAELTGAQREGVLRAAGKCLVKNTLLHPPAIAMEVDALTSVG